MQGRQKKKDDEMNYFSKHMYDKRKTQKRRKRVLNESEYQTDTEKMSTGSKKRKKETNKKREMKLIGIQNRYIKGKQDLGES